MSKSNKNLVAELMTRKVHCNVLSTLLSAGNSGSSTIADESDEAAISPLIQLIEKAAVESGFISLPENLLSTFALLVFGAMSKVITLVNRNRTDGCHLNSTDFDTAISGICSSSSSDIMHGIEVPSDDSSRHVADISVAPVPVPVPRPHRKVEGSSNAGIKRTIGHEKDRSMIILPAVSNNSKDNNAFHEHSKGITDPEELIIFKLVMATVCRPSLCVHLVRDMLPTLTTFVKTQLLLSFQCSPDW